MFKDNCLCYSTGFEIMLLGSFNIITRVRFKMNSKLVLLGRSLSLNSSLDHHFWSVQSLLCIFLFLSEFGVANYSTYPYEIKTTTPFYLLLRQKKSLYITISLCNFCFKKSTKFAFPCFTQIDKLFFANVLSSTFFSSIFYQPQSHMFNFLKWFIHVLSSYSDYLSKFGLLEKSACVTWAVLDFTD